MLASLACPHTVCWRGAAPTETLTRAISCCGTRSRCADYARRHGASLDWTADQAPPSFAEINAIWKRYTLVLLTERASEWPDLVKAELAKLPHFRTKDLMHSRMDTHNGGMASDSTALPAPVAKSKPNFNGGRVIRAKYQLAEAVVRRMIRENAIDVRLYETWANVNMLRLYGLQ